MVGGKIKEKNIFSCIFGPPYCTHYECCATTACPRHQCTTCSGRPWSADFSTAPRHGLDSVQLQTGRS